MTRFLAILLLASAACAQTSDLKRDEEIIFFPTMANRTTDGTAWELEIRGCVYEPEKRRLAVAALREALGLKGVKLTRTEQALFAERARLFMVDHERGRKIVVRLGERKVTLDESRSDGRFFARFDISDAEVQKLREKRTNGIDRITFEAVLPARDRRVFHGEISLLEPEGITVISDIDDTIKITEVMDRNATLRNTFLRPFEPVPGMAEAYQHWAQTPEMHFCFVSASPWQLYAPLADFVRVSGFPDGAFVLKEIRVKDKSLFNLFGDPETYKRGAIEPLFERFPQRRFVLVGDSGERDSEIYGTLARRFPEQVTRIYIRDVTGESADAERYRRAFRDVPQEKWQIFREPREIMAELSTP